jgi:membrane protease YdiL (CAAX protease family)
MAGLESWMRSMETLNQGMIEALLGSSSLFALAANILILALIPAICEELFFRGFLQRNMARMMRPHAAVWVTATIFSLVHLQFYGFFARLLLGVLLGYFLLGSRSLIPSIAAHFSFNLTSILLTYAAFNTDLIDPEVVLSDAYELPTGLVIVSLIAVTGLLIQYLRREPPATAGLT